MPILGTVIPEYHFRTEHPDPGTTRFLHVLFYLGAVLLLVAAVHAFYVYFTTWSGGDDNSHVWQLVLGVVYLIVSGLIAYNTYHHGEDAVGPAPERFVSVIDGRMRYSLDQLSGENELDLRRLRAVTRPSVRDLILTLDDDSQRVLPIYLIDEEAKQEELERILRAAASA